MTMTSLYAQIVTLRDLPHWTHELLAVERVARLGFNDDEGRPRVLPVTYAVVGNSVWSAIDDKPKRAPEPARLRYLCHRPQAALCVDHYSDDWTRLAWVQMLGRIDILQIDAAPRALAELSSRYRPYREQPPPGPLLRLTVEQALSWRARPGSSPISGEEPGSTE